jgi:hypothetical protein
MRGKELELHLSQYLHQKNTAFLISALFLRQRGLGQIDLAIMSLNKITLYEVKSSSTGKHALYKGEQITRLRKSAKTLCFLLKLDVELKIIAKR